MKTKTLLLFGLFFFFCLSLFAQTISESEVPQDVFISFKYKYPDAVVSGWEKQNDHYLAKFKLTDQEGKAEFTTDGKWAKSSFAIAEKELPSPIPKYVKANYPNHSIRESNFMKEPDASDVYLIVLKEQGIKDQVSLYFDIDGSLIKKEDSQENKANQVKKDNDAKKGNEEVVTPPQQTEVKKVDEGEPIAEAKVPGPAKTHFITKNKKATDASWFRVERDYVVKFTLAGKTGKSIYSEEGTWKETRMSADPATLAPLMLDYLKTNFRKYKTVKAEYVQTPPKNKFYEVQVVEKASKETTPPVTKVFFDGNGKYMSVERPDVADVDNNEDKEAADKEFLENVDASNQTIEKGTGVNDVINPKELPTDAIQYIKKVFPEHKIKECRYLFDDDLNAHIYYVTVKKEGDKYEIELYFDLTGKLLKKIDPTEQKYQNENPDGEGADNQISPKDNVSTDDVISSGAESIDPKELPSGITNYLKKNYPDHKVDQALYTTDDEFGNVYYLLLKKSGDKSKAELWFDLNGKLVKSEIPD